MNKSGKTTWTQEMIDDLAVMHTDGMSDREMANRLNIKYGKYFTRNAVIGRRHRCKLFDKFLSPGTVTEKNKRIKVAIVTGARMKRKPRPKKLITKHPVNNVAHRIERDKNKPQKPILKFHLDRPDYVCDKPVPLLELNRGMCHWPLDQGGYCGKQAEGSYCNYHRTVSTRG